MQHAACCITDDGHYPIQAGQQKARQGCRGGCHPPELLRSAASSFANAYLPLFWRAAWRLELPLAARGRFVQELWKGKADPAQCRSYRDIFVEDHIGKVYASELREQVLPYYTGHALQTQCGGIDGRGADLAVHMAASVRGAAEALDRSAGILFMDVVSAFASMARELLDVDNASDEVIIAYMQRHAFRPDDWYDLLRVLGAGAP